MNDRVLGMIGLATKAGKIIYGEDKLLEAIRFGKAKLVIIATDASDNTKKKFNDKCSYYKVKAFEYGTKATLQHAVVAINDRNFSDSVLNLLCGGK